MWLENFLESTNVLIKKPHAYGTFHLVFLAVGLTVVILAAYLLRNADDRMNRIVLCSVGGVLLVSEVYKQLLYYFVICDNSYPWHIFPFQLCSIPMYLCIIAPFIKNEKISGAMYDFMLGFNLMSGFLALLEPSGLLNERLPLLIHSFCWHTLLVFVGLYLGLSRRAGLKLKNFVRAAAIFLICCGIAFAINFGLYDVSGGEANMLYIGPANSPIIVFSDISRKYGWYINAPVYIASVTLGAFIFYLPFIVWNRRTAVKKAAAAV